eukprot:180490-Heterocapsa_arctica.AAC.1
MAGDTCQGHGILVPPLWGDAIKKVLALHPGKKVLDVIEEIKREYSASVMKARKLKAEVALVGQRRRDRRHDRRRDRRRATRDKHAKSETLRANDGNKFYNPKPYKAPAKQELSEANTEECGS